MNFTAFAEISSTINYLCYVLSSSRYRQEIPFHTYTKLHTTAFFIMFNRFIKGWHIDDPLRGNAFRAITKDGKTKDSVLLKIEEMTVGHGFFDRHLPERIYFWTDPKNSAVRIGDHQPIFSIYPYDTLKMNQPWIPN